MTKTDWTAQEVRSAIARMRVANPDELQVERMLNAFAERIEADESAVPVAVVSDAEWGKRLTWLCNGGKDLPPVGTKLFAHQPAQEQPGWKMPDVQEKYNELIFAVGNKYRDETRHETALRYIERAEHQTDGPCSASPTPPKEK